jgi:hypothetical protein
MITLQMSRANTLVFYRDDAAKTISSMDIIDATTGTAISSLVIVTNDTTNASVSAITAGDTTITATGLSVGTDYLITEAGLPSTRIRVISSVGTAVGVRFPVDYNYTAAGKCKGIKVTASYTPAVTGTYRAVHLQWLYTTTGEIYTEEACLVKFMVQCPVSLLDVQTRYPRILRLEPEWQYRAGVGWQPQITEAWERVREDLLSQSIILEKVRNSQVLRQLCLAHFGMILVDSGFDPLGQSDVAESRRTLYDSLQREWQRGLAARLNVDADETGAPQREAKRVSLSWERGSDADWRDKA